MGEKHDELPFKYKNYAPICAMGCPMVRVRSVDTLAKDLIKLDYSRINVEEHEDKIMEDL
ncbi:MAG: hypothetical protein QXR42_00045 [Candidatus Bathyarchaeia archaeon]